MKKPIDQTWTAMQDGEFWIVDMPHCVSSDTMGEDNAKLAAQAPDMARVLLGLATDGVLIETGSRQCPSCYVTWVPWKSGLFPMPPHYSHCAIMKVLRDAGVVP
jgi:hypothetical protein